MTNETKEFIFDLSNSANENGFKPNEKWQLSLVSESDRMALQKKYHATVVKKGAAEELLALYAPVLQYLKLESSEIPRLKNMQLDGIRYLVAYNPDREKR